MKEQGFIFEGLDVYQKSLGLSIRICKLASEFNFKYSRIRDQFIGAAVSIPLNIAEGNGRETHKDQINFYKIAKSSAFECIPLISICLELKLMEKDESEAIRDEIANICRMISGLIRYHRKK